MGSPAGTGDADEHPQHQVTLSAFELDKTEVTVAQYTVFYDQLGASQKCSDHNTASFLCGYPGPGLWDSADTYCHWGVSGKEQQPLNCADWFQAAAYCAWSHPGGRLPTEAEWEYAARGGGKDQTYPWGNTKASCAYAVCYEGTSGCNAIDSWTPCSKPNGNSSQGACDLAGNMMEWCADWYGPYSASPQTDPTGPAAGSAGPTDYPVLRGGSWWFDWSFLRSADRFFNYTTADERNQQIGFRCARTL